MKPASDHDLPAGEKHFGFLEIAVLLLSVQVLGAHFAQAAFHLPAELNVLLNRIDFLVCFVFFADFCVRFRRAPAKAAFMKWGWIDLVSSIPTVDALRWGRLVRVLSIIRILRAFRSMNHIVSFLFRQRMKSLIGTVILTGIVLVVFSCTAILACETAPDSNIKSPFDAIWWAFTTMTTTGYGDKYPVTVEGKIVAILLMVTGVVLFGVVSGLSARFFMDAELRQEDNDIARLAEEVRLLREQVDRQQRGG
jgi:voltage-gated potassium channel